MAEKEETKDTTSPQTIEEFLEACTGEDHLDGATNTTPDEDDREIW